MSARINYTVSNVVVRQIDRLAVSSESELQNAHSRKPKVVAQRFDIGCDHSQVFCNDGQLAQSVSENGEKLSSGDFNPLPAFSRLVSAWNFPAPREPAKVIDSKYVN